MGKVWLTRLVGSAVSHSFLARRRALRHITNFQPDQHLHWFDHKSVQRLLPPSRPTLTLGRHRSIRTVSNSDTMLAMLVRAAVALLVLGTATAAVAQTPALSQKSSDASELVARVQQSGSVRVIVLFEPPV